MPFIKYEPITTDDTQYSILKEFPPWQTTLNDLQESLDLNSSALANVLGGCYRTPPGLSAPPAKPMRPLLSSQMPPPLPPPPPPLPLLMRGRG